MTAPSGTGTPATAAGTATLATLRDRIRTMLLAAGGETEPLPVAASATTLTALRDRVEAFLRDAANARWSTSDLDEAIRQILEQYSLREPRVRIGTLALTSNGREIALSSLDPAPWRIEKVWWDYDSTSPGYPPNWRHFEVWPDGVLYIDDPGEPQSGDVVRIFYTCRHTLDGLDSATATTIPEEDIGHIVIGAAAIAAHSRAVELAEELNVDRDVVKRLMDWGDAQHKTFRQAVYERVPAWQRYVYAYDQDDLDEALRWALARYSEIAPAESIAVLTLTSGGRELSLASLTGLLTVRRVWFPYDSSDPDFPPRFIDFEIWPGQILYLDSSREPQTGDVARIWYTHPQTLTGLDGAGVTTLPASDETLIVAGAAGYAAQERIQEKPSSYVPSKLYAWAEERQAEFEQGLRAVARRLAVRRSGIAPTAGLDRWDDQNTGWN